MTVAYNWKRLRKALRRFVDRSGWTPGEIASAMAHDFGHMIPPTGVMRLLDVSAPSPDTAHGYDPFARMLLLTANNVPPYSEWHARRRAMEKRKCFYLENDRLRAVAAAEEDRRELERRQWLAREARPGHRDVKPSSDPLAGLDAATIAALSGGTIVMRGARL